MARFFRLVKNEYIKIIGKVSTWIMLCLVVLTALGLCLISVVAKNQMANSYNYGDTFNADDITQEIRYLEQYQPDGYQEQIQLNQLLLEHEIAYNDWRYQAATDYMDANKQLTEATAGQSNQLTAALTQARNAYLQAVENNDWRVYCEAKIAYQNSINPQMDAQELALLNWEYQYRLDADIPYDNNDWKSNLVSQTANLKQAVAQSEQALAQGQPVDQAELAESQNTLLINEYRLAHNIPLDVGTSSSIFVMDAEINFWSVFGSSSSLLSVISLLIVVIAGSCVANEFSNGTIKFLLINPVKRGKILMSKYTAVLTFSYVMLLLFYIMSMLFSMLFYGVGNLGAPYLYVSGGAVHSISGFLYVAWVYLLGSVNIIVMATLAFAISSLVRSSALAIGVGVFSMLAGNTITTFLKGVLNLDWSRYLIFANTDLNAIIQGTSMYANQTVSFALIVVAVHMAVFLLTAWDGFTRREV